MGLISTKLTSQQRGFCKRLSGGRGEDLSERVIREMEDLQIGRNFFVYPLVRAGCSTCKATFLKLVGNLTFAGFLLFHPMKACSLTAGPAEVLYLLFHASDSLPGQNWPSLSISLNLSGEISRQATDGERSGDHIGGGARARQSAVTGLVQQFTKQRNSPKN